MKSFMHYNTSGLVIVGMLLGVAIGSQLPIGALWGGLSGVVLGVLALVGLRHRRDSRAGSLSAGTALAAPAIGDEVSGELRHPTAHVDEVVPED